MEDLDTWVPVKNWMGREVVDFVPGLEVDFPKYFYRFAEIRKKGRLFSKKRREQETFSAEQCIEAFLKLDDLSKCSGLVMGCYPSEGDFWELPHQAATDLLVENANRLLGLRHVFLGDFTACGHIDISMVLGGNIHPILSAYPGLESLRMRSSKPAIDPIRHICLRSLIIEGSGLDNDFIENLGRCVFPNLEELILYPGGEEYGLNDDLSSIEPFLKTNPFPALRRLGICNCSALDRVVPVLTESDVLKQLDSLDLSLGTLDDEGGRKLIAGEQFRSLKELDLSHHYMSNEMMEELKSVFGGLDKLSLDRGEAEHFLGEEQRYTAVGE